MAAGRLQRMITLLVVILSPPVFFYGCGGGDNNETPGTTSAQVEWRPIASDRVVGVPPDSIPGRAAAAYDETQERIVMTWGRFGTTILDKVFGLQLLRTDKFGLWSKLVPSGETPNPKADHTVVYDPASNRMLIFGGYDDLGTTNEVWELGNFSTDPDGNLSGVWRKLIPSGDPPPARRGHVAVFDGSNNRMLVFGGFDGAATYFNDTWELSFGSGDGAWTPINLTGKPPERAEHSAILDPVNDRMVIFGGFDGVNYLSDAYELSWAGGTESWKEMTPSGLSPTARSGHTAVYDSLKKWMVVFGGFNGSANLNDSKALDLTPPGNETWIQLSLVGTEIPPARSQHIAIHDPVGQRMIVYGGEGPIAITGDIYQLKIN